MLSQKNLFSAMPAFLDPFDDVKKYTGWNTDEFSSLSALPMFHISAMTSLVSWSITGHSINLCNNLKYFYRDLGAMHSEVMAVVPVLLKSIYSDVMKGRRDRLNGLCVLTCGAAMFDPKILSDMMEKGFFVAQMYGLTETCGDGAWNSSQEAKYLTSVGHVDLSCEYKLDDGELCMRGDPIMLGYYKDPEGTAEVIDADGWFHTGDIARVEEDGYMYLTGRKKNVIILDSGENVSPEELEKLLVPCADIQECIVKEKDKKICAFIYCDPAKQETVKEFVTGVKVDGRCVRPRPFLSGDAGSRAGAAAWGQPRPAAVQAHGAGAQRTAAAPQRHGKTAALNTGGNRTMRKIRVLDNVYDLITINMEDRFKDNVAFRFYDTANDAVTTIL